MVCPQRMSVELVRSGLRTARRGNWSWSSDSHRSDRFGWIGHFQDDGPASQKLQITIPVLFSDAARLDVTVMRSYEHFLDAHITLDAPGCSRLDNIAFTADNPAELMGSWKVRHSLPEVISWDFGEPVENPLGGYSLRPWASSCRPNRSKWYNATIRVQPPKNRSLLIDNRFKLVDIWSC